MGDGETLRTCPGHRNYVVPLIATFKFPKAEQWCPFCGWTTGTFFSDHSVQVPATEELVTRLAVYQRAAKAFLASDTLGWTYEVLAEELPQIPEDPNRPVITCDGCGKQAPAKVLTGRCGTTYTKPDHWFRKGSDYDPKTACSRACVAVIAKRDGGDGMILPW